jgi:hypothetical protein
MKNLFFSFLFFFLVTSVYAGNKTHYAVWNCDGIYTVSIFSVNSDGLREQKFYQTSGIPVNGNCELLSNRIGGERPSTIIAFVVDGDLQERRLYDKDGDIVSAQFLKDGLVILYNKDGSIKEERYFP